MLKAIEVGLLAVSFLVFLGLIITAPARRRSKTETEEARLSADTNTAAMPLTASAEKTGTRR